MTTFKVVERSTNTMRRSVNLDALWVAAQETLENGKAIEVPLMNEFYVGAIRQALTQRALRNRINCIVHCVVDKEKKTANVWLEMRK